MIEHVQLVREIPASGTLWSPVVGEETARLLADSGLDDVSRLRVEDQSVAILSSCLPPLRDRGAEQRTGLVVGYVQSGKTLSFTAVTALARDNGFPLVILLAGTKTNLHRQTSKRLRRDLKVERAGGMSPWLLVDNPKAGNQGAEAIAKAVQSANDPALPLPFRQTVVITVMKNKTRLDAVTAVLNEMSKEGVLGSHTPVLVIDDEADQAGLNTRDAEDPSATYGAIMRLRAAVPRHTYLMYTATPQAPLLLNLADTLSPDFVRVLDPGDEYTGGEYFFVEHRATFLQTIPESEAQAAVDPENHEPPDSLLDALATFLVAVVSQQGKRQLAMLVHPSHAKDMHQRYRAWISGILDAWQETLQLGGPDRDDLVEGFLEPAWRRLSTSNAPVVTLEQVLNELPHWIARVRVQVVNSEVPEEDGIPWGVSPAWILVGGNKLDRGFTVEGLVVTYMPRGAGVGNADTIQQRARFFGYKRPYAEFCRAWLAPLTAHAFSRYVEHERYLRKELTELESAGQGLKGWKRRMLLDPALRPCRRSVISLPHLHSKVPAEKWLRFERLVQLAEQGQRHNRALVSRVVEALRWQEHPLDERSDHRHQIATSSLADLVGVLLEPWAAHPQDQIVLNQLLLVLSAGLDEYPGEPADVVWMRQGLSRRRRIVSAPDGLVLNLQEGRRPGDTGYSRFPGDAAFHTEDRVTVQLFSVDATDGADGPVVARDLRALAVWVPRHLAGGALVEAPE